MSVPNRGVGEKHNLAIPVHPNTSLADHLCFVPCLAYLLSMDLVQGMVLTAKFDQRIPLLSFAQSGRYSELTLQCQAFAISTLLALTGPPMSRFPLLTLYDV